jgi:hypothetical protein
MRDDAPGDNAFGRHRHSVGARPTEKKKRPSSAAWSHALDKGLADHKKDSDAASEWLSHRTDEGGRPMPRPLLLPSIGEHPTQ